MKLFCLIKHKWSYYGLSADQRQCDRCGKSQIFIWFIDKWIAY